MSVTEESLDVHYNIDPLGLILTVAGGYQALRAEGGSIINLSSIGAQDPC